MAVNDTVIIADYNDIRAKVISVLGSGSADFGYGQAIRSSNVTISNSITVNEWGNLYTDILNCFIHQTGSPPASPSTANVGGTVRYNATASPNFQYDTFADTIRTNRFSIHPTRSRTINKGTSSTTWPGVYGDSWNTRISATVTVTFSNSTNARHFFNSGGEIRINSTLTGSTANTQTTTWASLLTSAGTRRFGGNMPTPGLGTMNGQNFYRLTNFFQLWSSVSASSPYADNIWRIWARSNVANNSSGTANQILFLVEWIDGYVDPGNSPFDTPNTIDSVFGTINLAVSTLEATGALQPAGAPTFTVETPEVSIGTIAP
jgi:hypothetical protein